MKSRAPVAPAYLVVARAKSLKPHLRAVCSEGHAPEAVQMSRRPVQENDRFVRADGTAVEVSRDLILHTGQCPACGVLLAVTAPTRE